MRPEPGASATAQGAHRQGLETVVMPLFRVEPVDWRSPDPAEFDALLLTSANAIRYGGPGLEGLKPLPAHCVGEATASAARVAGFDVELVGTGGVDELLERLPPELKLLHLSSTQRRTPDCPAQPIVALPVYCPVELPRPERFGEVEGAVVAIHSPRAAAALCRHLGEAGVRRSSIAIAAISSQAAEAAGEGWRAVAIAEQPSDSSLLAIAAALCNNPS